MVSTRPPTSISSSPFNHPLVTESKAPVTSGILVTFMSNILFNSLTRSRLLSSFSYILSILFYDQPASKVYNFDSSFIIIIIIIRPGLLTEIRWSLCLFESHRSLCVSFSRTGAWLYIYHSLVWSNLNFLHISQWITLHTQSCQILYYFCGNLLHSLVMWLMV